MPIRVTRKLLSAALDGSLAKVSFRADPILAFRYRRRSRAMRKICLTPLA